LFGYDFIAGLAPCGFLAKSVRKPPLCQKESIMVILSETGDGFLS